MFGGLYPDGQQGGAELLADLTLEKIDFDWIENQTKPNFLKKAIKLIEEDEIDIQSKIFKIGDYYVDLKQACINKLTKLDPSKAQNTVYIVQLLKHSNLFQLIYLNRPKIFNNNIDDKEKRVLEQDIFSWEQELKRKETEKEKSQKIIEVEVPQNTKLTDQQKKQRAENEKNKGNEALKSKDYKEAIEYYTKSIEYDPKLAASYCNRALVYLKLKEYEKVIKDCNIAIELDRNYLKAYHRRGKARFAQDKVYEAYCDFKFIMEKEPENKEVNGDLKECQDLLKNQNQNPEKGFKRVQIVEEDDDHEEEESCEEKIKVSNEQIDQEKKVFYDKQINDIEAQKEKANSHIKNGLFDKALEILQCCIAKINSLGSFSNSIEDQKEYQRKKANYLNNISLCYKQVDDNKSVISYTNQVIEMKKSLSSEVLVKAYLRRGMAFERLEKYKRSQRDFLKVKNLEPGNLQASQGLRRVQQCTQYDKDILSGSDTDDESQTNSSTKIQVEEEEEMILIKKDEKKEFKEFQKETAQPKEVEKKTDKIDNLVKLKEEGNALFSSKDFEGALKKFRDVALDIEVNYVSRLNKKEQQITQLYLQVLSNQSLCLLNLNRFDEVIKSTTSALYYQEENVKCLYRRAQAYKAIGDSFKDVKTIENLKIKYEKYEKSRKDLEKVNQIDKNNTMAKQLLQEVTKLGVEVKLALRHLETEKVIQKSQDTKEQTKDAETEKITSKKETQTSQITQNLTTQDLNKLTEQALQSATSNIVNDFKLPDSSTAFEKDFNQLKNSNDKLYAYIKQIPTDYYAKLYDKNDLPSNILLSIIRVLQQHGANENKELCQRVIRGLSQTCKFNLCVKFIAKKEKKEIKDLLDSIGLGQSQDLLDLFKL